ncbi:Kinesin-like protein KIF12 [Hondaea fermentalgiana]|uniref:Kinesin-like protein n=1 Tax=Hondaea fermentalgiana TaxID=2315210 RepID=A0A2R5GJG4_9STRA|nr:Kinesin-like protein KIF12 [Hondaea fermentalgiana]|eukprot:GBG30459.1 Kinesin-like protein KIF12 [Hondaea fermentalgiana]
MSSQASSRASSRGSLLSKSSVESARSGQSAGSTNSDNVRVIVRCRPLSEKEADQGEDEVVEVESGDTVRLELGALGASRTQKKFRFNAVMGPECSQTQFFETCGVKALLESALDGYAATVFAYGQTGSGKTYSMSGYEEQIAEDAYQGDAQSDGLIPRSMSYIFSRIRQLKSNVRLKASFCEIYNEQVYDLLNLTTASLPVRWKPGKGFFVQDLFVVECQTLSDIMEVVCEGHRNRRVGSHELNKDSSRSHSILTLNIETESSDPDDGHAVVKFGKIVFCDLAGSERLKDTKSDGITLTETGAINKSLFALSNVISALTTSATSGAASLSSASSSSPSSSGALTAHIPYRDSKLTKLLMDSLGGSSLTLMICCCSPAAAYADETLSTLQYAHRASKIRNRPTVHLDGKEQLISRLREEIKHLRVENAYLREQLATARPTLENSPSDSGHSTEHVIASFEREIERLKAENREIRTREFMADRNCQNAMIENERLTQKLEHLEEVFVHEPNPSGSRNEHEQLYTANLRLQQQVGHLKALLADSNHTSGADLEPLRSENAYLRDTIAQLRKREHSLLRELQQRPSRRPEARTIIEDAERKDSDRSFLFSGENSL